jgi:hypothetical protein
MQYALVVRGLGECLNPLKEIKKFLATKETNQGKEINAATRCFLRQHDCIIWNNLSPSMIDKQD